MPEEWLFAATTAILVSEGGIKFWPNFGGEMAIVLLKEGILEGDPFTKRFGALRSEKSVFGVGIAFGHKLIVYFNKNN